MAKFGIFNFPAFLKISKFNNFLKLYSDTYPKIEIFFKSSNFFKIIYSKFAKDLQNNGYTWSWQKSVFLIKRNNLTWLQFTRLFFAARLTMDSCRVNWRAWYRRRAPSQPNHSGCSEPRTTHATCCSSLQATDRPSALSSACPERPRSHTVQRVAQLVHFDQHHHRH